MGWTLFWELGIIEKFKLLCMPWTWKRKINKRTENILIANVDWKEITAG